MLKIHRRVSRLKVLLPRQWGILAMSLILLPTIQLSLRVYGFQRTAQRLARCSDGDVRTYDSDVVGRTVEPISIVAGRPMVGARCLGRSLLLWFLLRRKGIDASMVIGTLAPTDDALVAHAWVEVDGLPVNDDPDIRDRYGSFGLSLPGLRTKGTKDARHQ